MLKLPTAYISCQCWQQLVKDVKADNSFYLPNQTYQTNSTKAILPNQTKLSRLSLLNQNWVKPILLVKAVNEWVRSAFGNVYICHIYMNHTEAHILPNYISSYVTLTTDSGQKGFGLAFTLGRGNEIICHCIDSLRFLVIGVRYSSIKHQVDTGHVWN